MSLVGIAGSMGTTTSALQALIQGHVDPGVAGQVGCKSSSLQQFVNGGTSIGLAGAIGTTSASLQELRNLIGDQGAIGLVIGLAVGLNDDSGTLPLRRDNDRIG